MFSVYKERDGRRREKKGKGGINGGSHGEKEQRGERADWMERGGVGMEGETGRSKNGEVERS